MAKFLLLLVVGALVLNRPEDKHPIHEVATPPAEPRTPMTTLDARYRRPSQGRVDFTLRYVAHDAFRRDLRRLTAAVVAGRVADPGTVIGWETFKDQMHIHHSVEDAALWPPLRQKVTRPATWPCWTRWKPITPGSTH